MSHHCQALVLHCIDFRFHTAIRDFLVSLGLKNNYDLVSLAGAAKGLADKDAASTQLILKQIEISEKLHGISEVYLMHHLDCGAYGGHAAFPDLQAERARQIQDMRSARKIILDKFSKLEVKNVLARIQPGPQGDQIDFEMVGN
ncbi:MAG: carbonic anhydrase [Patescibacteria group bacterium]|jgi:carbonic anhydrase